MSPRLALVGAAMAAALSLGVAFALPAVALPGDDSNCPEGASKTCTQTPPQDCPQGTLPAPVQTPGSTTCTLDSLVKARAKAELLTQDQLIKLCADARVRGLADVRIAVGHPKWEIITLDGRTCGEHRPIYKDCWTAMQAGYHDVPSTDPRYDRRLDGNHDGIACETPPAGGTTPTPVLVVPVAPAPTIVGAHLPVTH